MITLDVPSQQQAVIRQASEAIGMDVDNFIIRQAYDNAIKILTSHGNASSPIEEGLLTDLLKGKKHPKFNEDFVEVQRAMRDEWD